MVLFLSAPSRAETDSLEIEAFKRKLAVLDERVIELEAMKPQVTLEVDDALNLHHPHAFADRNH